MKAIILFGPSGAGKSTTAKAIATDWNYLYLEADQWPNGDGIDSFGIRAEWDYFLREWNIIPLRNSILNKSIFSNKSGAVLSLPSLLHFPVELMYRTTFDEVYFLCIYGEIVECKSAFLNSEKAKEFKLDGVHWDVNNLPLYETISKADYQPFIVPSFENNTRVKVEDILSIISSKLGIKSENLI